MEEKEKGNESFLFEPALERSPTRVLRAIRLELRERRASSIVSLGAIGASTKKQHGGGRWGGKKELARTLPRVCPKQTACRLFEGWSTRTLIPAGEHGSPETHRT